MVYTDQAIYFNGECFKWENTDSRVEIIESDFNFSEVELCETETDWIYQTRLWRRKQAHKLQDAQAEKLTSLQANKLTS